MGDITAKTWLVIRRYRGKMRVVSISAALSEAETSFLKESEKLRDGDVHLYECTGMKQISVLSGGYNRTRW